MEKRIDTRTKQEKLRVANFIDLTGKRFGRLTVIQRHGDITTDTKWLCKCDCGGEKIVRGVCLRYGHTKSCGCLAQESRHRRRLEGLEGKKIGRLTVIEEAGRNNKNEIMWKCRCECGNATRVSDYSLRHNKTQSCGCLHKEKFNHSIHGMANTRFFKIWTGILYRCDNKNSTAYKNYGGRGITYDARWKSFENFKEDMYESYCLHFEEHGKDTSIDRIDVNGNYTKDNCRWATQLVQANNTRMNVKVPGTELTLAEYARENNINYHTVQSAVYKQRNPTRRKKERCTK